MKLSFLLAIIICAFHTPLIAQLPVSVDPVVLLDAEEQEMMRLSADSLKSVWASMWRSSDSLRIEAMLVRMRSDSMRRVLGSADTIPQAIRILAKANVAASLRESSKFKPGQTLSDSLTFESMRLAADTGVASYYASEFHGKKTSSGERYDMNGLTCAHRWLPFGTSVRITNIANGKEIVVKVNDRGPFKHGRIVDVSKRAAQELGMIGKGTALVSIQVVD